MSHIDGHTIKTGDWNEEEFIYYCTSKGIKFMEKSDRWNEGKTEWSLIDFPSIECLAKVLMFGKQKYAQDNWKKGWYKKDLVDSLLRHTLAIARGEVFDPEHSLPHVAGVLFNAMALEYCRLNNKFLDEEIHISHKQS